MSLYPYTSVIVGAFVDPPGHIGSDERPIQLYPSLCCLYAASIPHSAASIPQPAASVPHSAASFPHSIASIPHSAASIAYSAASIPQFAASIVNMRWSGSRLECLSE